MARHFRETFEFRLSQLCNAHIMHNLNDEVTLCITIYGFGWTNMGRGEFVGLDGCSRATQQL